MQPAVAQANLEEGHPEWYGNNKLVSLESRMGVVQWGPLRLQEVNGEREIECAAHSFGYVTNEGTPTFGKGRILAWGAAGDATAEGRETIRSCFFYCCGGTAEVEGWMTDESAIFEPPEGSRKTPLSVPWNLELLCVEHEGVKSALMRIGVPNGAAAPASECKTETARAEEIAGEETRREACFAVTVPEGCMKVNVVGIQLGLEQVTEGSLQLKYTNGFTNGLHPSAWTSEGGAAAGQLHVRGNFASAWHVVPLGNAHTRGPSTAKSVGFGGLQLVTVK
jgi:hypothetical protein